jgi:hypothetical protein
MANNKFLIFDQSKTNIEDDTTYSTDGQRADGLVPGQAKSILHNKLFYQVSCMAYAIAQTIVDTLSADCVDATPATVVTQIKNTYQKALYQKLEAATATLLGLTAPNDNVDAAVLKVRDDACIASYMAFCANVNVNSLDAAFGKNNESNILNIGRQLAMYAWFNGLSSSTYPFTHLCVKGSLYDCLNDVASLVELFSDFTYIVPLIRLSPFALGLYNNAIASSSLMAKTLAIIGGANPDNYSTLSSIFSDSALTTTLVNNSIASTMILEIPAITTAINASTSASNIFAASSNIVTKMCNNAAYMANVFVNYGIKTALWDSTAASIIILNNATAKAYMLTIALTFTNTRNGSSYFSATLSKKCYALQGWVGDNRTSALCGAIQPGGGTFTIATLLPSKRDLYYRLSPLTIGDSYWSNGYISYISMEA